MEGGERKCKGIDIHPIHAVPSSFRPRLVATVNEREVELCYLFIVVAISYSMKPKPETKCDKTGKITLLREREREREIEAEGEKDSRPSDIVWRAVVCRWMSPTTSSVERCRAAGRLRLAKARCDSAPTASTLLYSLHSTSPPSPPHTHTPHHILYSVILQGNCKFFISIAAFKRIVRTVYLSAFLQYSYSFMYLMFFCVCVFCVFQCIAYSLIIELL